MLTPELTIVAVSDAYCRATMTERAKILLTSGYTARAMANGFHDIEGLELLNKPFRKRDLPETPRRARPALSPSIRTIDATTPSS